MSGDTEERMYGTVADPGEGGYGGWNPPFLFWPIYAFEWEHIVKTPFTLGWEPPFLKWLDPPPWFKQISTDLNTILYLYIKIRY